MKFFSLVAFVLCTFIVKLPAVTPHKPLIVTSGDHKLWSEALGDKENIDKPILLISGCGCSARSWPNYFCDQLVDAGYYVIRFDHRDVGLSSKSSVSYQIHDLAKDAVAVLDAHGIQKAHIMGDSMGGMVAQMVTLEHPSYVNTLTLISTAPIAIPIPPGVKPEQAIPSGTLKYLTSTLRDVPQTFGEGYPSWKDRYTTYMGEYPLDEDLFIDYVKDIYTRNNHLVSSAEVSHKQALLHFMQTVHQRQGMLKKINAPTLVIHGEKDELLPAAHSGKVIAQFVDGATLELIPKMGHAFYNREVIDTIANKTISFINANQALPLSKTCLN